MKLPLLTMLFASTAVLAAAEVLPRLEVPYTAEPP